MVGEVVVSGGKDEKVMIWEFGDVSMGGGVRGKEEKEGSGAFVVGGGLSLTEFVRYMFIWVCVEFLGYIDMIEDVCFNLWNEWELCLVGDDWNMFFWDTRTKKAAGFAKGAYADDVYCVVWSVFEEYVIVIGGKDIIVKVWDC